LRFRVGRRRAEAGQTFPKSFARTEGNEEDEPNSGEKRRVERNEFFDVESKTIVTIGKYEKRK
jgi:hypothetical protein